MWPFKKKPIKLTFYTFRPDVYEHYKIDKTSKFMPKWLNTIKKNKDWTIADHRAGNAQIKTMRTCYGFLKIMKAGWVIPLWTDLKVEVAPEGEVKHDFLFGDNTTTAAEHPPNQRGDLMPIEKFAHMKINTPWIATCSEPIDFYFAPSLWLQDDPTSVLFPEGIVDYVYQNSLNINMMFIRKSEMNTVDFKAGHPMTQVIPLTDRPVEMECKLVSRHEFDRILHTNHNEKFTGSTLNRKNKCPFHRGG